MKVSPRSSFPRFFLSSGAQAADGIWPSWFHYLYPRSRAPTRILVSQCGWVCVATCSLELKVLIRYFSFCVFLFYGLAVLCLLVLRQTREPTPGAYHTPWYVRVHMHACTLIFHAPCSLALPHFHPHRFAMSSSPKSNTRSAAAHVESFIIKEILLPQWA